MNKIIGSCIFISLFISNVIGLESFIRESFSLMRDMMTDVPMIRDNIQAIQWELDSKELVTKEVIERLTIYLQNCADITGNLYRRTQKVMDLLPEEQRSNPHGFRYHEKLLRIEGFEKDLNNIIQDFKDCIRDNGKVDQKKYQKTAKGFQEAVHRFQSTWSRHKIQTI